ncbi:Slam-dependent surface lipoprotein [Suttonella ornithocola]|uniref:Transferrin-binding protein 2 n=1 Tax=Suttonella ornithocola TaxID=279832 RepID=A0A380MP98_9GAMM|nr:Slam-dependent surface lipoprotein [Suttonella ornithocola]SUO94004.1 Transferrin-binding protein 2 precursor [Suttonella ornithocola]
MKYSQLTLLISTALFLTACGGGGSSDLSATSNVSNNNHSNTSETNFNNNNSSGHKPANLATNHAIKLSIQDAQVTQLENVDNQSVDLNQLIVDGQTIPLTYPGISAVSFISINGSNVSGNHMSYARYGTVNSANGPYIFSQGQVTPAKEIPQTGIATYKGLSVYVSKEREASTGSSEFNVDFGQKTLTGNIHIKDITDIALNANIQGNTFKGKTVEGVETQGSFYGPKAAELSGVYSNANQKISGAYGAVLVKP